jgi:hypothetical protein
VAPLRTLVPVTAVAAVALAVPALSACSGASSEGATSTSSTSSPSSPSASTAVPSVTVTGTPALPSVDASRLAAIGTCLKNAGLPTPTSTDVAGGAAELLRILQDPATVAALRACNIPIPSGSLSVPTTSTS